MALNDLIPCVLIANRGEIACRVIRTCKAHGIRTVAVFHDLDRFAPHVGEADVAVEIFGEPATQAYLDQAQIIAAAKAEGATAIHPGYGFLSENAGFVEAVTTAGLAFIGPHAKAIAAMGDKIESKRLAKAAGVNTIPGTEDAVQDGDEAVRVAAEIGFPVMLKASAGGGGKGMRIARSEDEVREGFAAAVSEAKVSFGDDRVFIERYIEQPRHIEIQVMGDKHKNVLHLMERECSIQRRHQKIIEEAPSPFIHAETRAAMAAQAVALAAAVGYDNAGTVEFIVDKDQNFFFLEMNTRLQVEHPITEAITGQDLVELQLLAAAGEALPITQEDIVIAGHAIELRICAEDPDQDFMPAIGTLRKLTVPQDVRFDTGVRQGDAVSPAFDPMLAKLIVHGATRAEAIAKAIKALEEMVLLGCTTNAPYLARILRHKAFQAGETTTAFVADYADDLAAPVYEGAQLQALLAAAALGQPAFQRLRAAPGPAPTIGAWRP